MLAYNYLCEVTDTQVRGELFRSSYNVLVALSSNIWYRVIYITTWHMASMVMSPPSLALKCGCHHLMDYIPIDDCIIPWEGFTCQLSICKKI